MGSSLRAGTLFLRWTAILTILILLSVIFLSLLFFLFFKRPWWKLLSKTRTVAGVANSRQKIRRSFILVATLLIAGVLVIIYPFLSGKATLKQSFTPSYPVTREMKIGMPFAIKNHGKDPVDYVFDLFEKYGIVVISERLHPNIPNTN